MFKTASIRFYGIEFYLLCIGVRIKAFFELSYIEILSESMTCDFRKGPMELSTFFCDSILLLMFLSYSVYSKLCMCNGFLFEKVGDSKAFCSFSAMDVILGEALGSYMMFATLPTEILNGL